MKNIKKLGVVFIVVILIFAILVVATLADKGRGKNGLRFDNNLAERGFELSINDNLDLFPRAEIKSKGVAIPESLNEKVSILENSLIAVSDFRLNVRKDDKRLRIEQRISDSATPAQIALFMEIKEEAVTIIKLSGEKDVRIEIRVRNENRIEPNLLNDVRPLLLLETNLSGMNEIPATSSTATGRGTFVVDSTANTLKFDITFEGLSGNETAAHIHGPAGINETAGVLFALPLGEHKTGVWNYNETLENDIITGRTYVNVHSNLFPAGEIRGQIK